jgi:hypothetical protein
VETNPLPAIGSLGPQRVLARPCLDNERPLVGILPLLLNNSKDHLPAPVS